MIFVLSSSDERDPSGDSIIVMGAAMVIGSVGAQLIVV